MAHVAPVSQVHAPPPTAHAPPTPPPPKVTGPAASVPKVDHKVDTKA